MSTTDKLCDLLKQRHEAGLKKYGVTVDRTDLTPEQWAQHAIEELLDGAAYLMRLKEEVAKLRERVKRLEESMELIVDEVPAQDGGGGFFWPMCDGEGNEIGTQPVDPLTVIQAMQQRAYDALADRKEKP